MNQIVITRRVTSSFLQSIPNNIDYFNSYLYAVVKRKRDKIIQDSIYGYDVRLDPCYFDWASKTITMVIPYNINPGITSVDDIEPSFFESVQAAFINLMQTIDC